MKYMNRPMEEISESFYRLIIQRNQEINDLYKLLNDNNLGEVFSIHQKIQKEKDNNDHDLTIFKKYRLDNFIGKTPAQLSYKYKQKKREKIITFWKTWEEFKSLTLLGKIGLIMLYLFILANIIAYTIGFFILAFRIVYAIKSGKWN